MDSQQYQNIKDLVYATIQERLRVTPSIKEEIVQRFTEWFQGLVVMAKTTQMAAQMPVEGEEGR